MQALGSRVIAAAFWHLDNKGFLLQNNTKLSP